eukprot:7344036-Prorocentrum_lima.AAC.1
MTSSLVGSEMCIRDRSEVEASETRQRILMLEQQQVQAMDASQRLMYECHCLLYTSDAADDM